MRSILFLLRSQRLKFWLIRGRGIRAPNSYFLIVGLAYTQAPLIACDMLARLRGRKLPRASGFASVR